MATRLVPLIPWWKSLTPRSRQWVAVAAAGFFARFVLSQLSFGSNDATLWAYFAEHIDAVGLLETYRRLDGRPGVLTFNHPPVAALWVWLCGVVANDTGLRFPVLLRFAGLAAEVASAVLIWARVRPAGQEAAAAAVAAFAWALCSLLVAGFHGNTDCVYACFILAAVLAFEDGRPFHAGLWLAAALNVKLIPLFVVPAFVASCRDWRSLARFVGGLSLAVVPFVPLLVFVPNELFHHVLGYSPVNEYWGVNGWLLVAARLRLFLKQVPGLIDAFNLSSRWLSLGALVVCAAWARWRARSVGESALLGLVVFLLLTPGFVVQYTVCLCPLWFAVERRWAFAWATLSGLLVWLAYDAYFVPGSFPWRAWFTGPLPTAAAVFGFMSWGLLVAWVVRTARTARVE